MIVVHNMVCKTEKKKKKENHYNQLFSTSLQAIFSLQAVCFHFFGNAIESTPNCKHTQTPS